MAIKFLPTLGDTPREFQRAMAEVGRIRLGRFNPDKGKRGAPDKLDRFRFTSDDPELIHAVAREFGGQPAQYTPQRSNKTSWEVISEARTIEVLVPPQVIEPWNEAWRPGLCVRRCDGEWEIKEAETKGLDRQPCPCNLGKVAAADLCKPTIRVKLMLPNVPPGIGVWRLESHGEYACSELGMSAPFIRQLSTIALAQLSLRQETRRRWNPEKGRHDTLEFFVPTLLLNTATPAQLAAGGAVLAEALQAKGGLALDGRPTRALEAPTTPTSGSVEPEPAATPAYPDGGPGGDPGLKVIAANQGITLDEARTRILRDIEATYTLDALMEIKAKLTARGVADQRVREVWNGRKNAVRAAAEFNVLEAAGQPSAAQAQANAEHQRALREQQDRVAESHRMNEAAIASGTTDRNGGAPPPEWAVDPHQDAVEAAAAGELPEYAVGDTVTVGGIEFTKISDNPFPPGSAAVQVVVEHPPVGADRVLDLDEEWSLLFAAVPLWTTADVHAKVKAFCGVEKSSQATAEQLHALTAAIKRGEAQ